MKTPVMELFGGRHTHSGDYLVASHGSGDHILATSPDQFTYRQGCRNNKTAYMDKCPNGLSLVISFSGYPEGNRLPEWLSPEIKDRLDKKTLLLPPLSEGEA